MKWIVTIFSLLIIGLLAYVTTNSRSTDLLQDQTEILHHFIKYEYNFYKLNRCNHHPDTCTAKALDDRTNLLSKLSKSSTELSDLLGGLVKQYPYIDKVTKPFAKWKVTQEQKLLRGEYLLYWQVELLKFQIYLQVLLEGEDSSLNANIVKLVPIYKDKLKGETKERLCAMTRAFGKVEGAEATAKTIAAIELTGKGCFKGGIQSNG